MYHNDMKNSLLKRRKFSILHKSFRIAILVKGIDGLLEILGGILLIFLNPTRLNKIIVLLTQHELSEDPKDIVANYAMRLASDFSLSSQSFGVFYLISHGIIKLFLILMLWNKKTWAYPLTIFSLLLFIFYQLYRCAIKYSIWLNVLSIFDLAIVILTLIEYRLIKHHIN